MNGHGAHLPYGEILDDLELSHWTCRHESVPYSPWQLLEHMRLAQADILAYSRDSRHVSPSWPEGYWPEDETPSDAKAVRQAAAAFQKDLDAMIERVRDTENDLFEPFKQNPDHNLLRQALLLADHNAYHLGQIITLRRVAGCWPA